MEIVKEKKKWKLYENVFDGLGREKMSYIGYLKWELVGGKPHVVFVESLMLMSIRENIITKLNIIMTEFREETREKHYI